jgi:hypothetical protein
MFMRTKDSRLDLMGKQPSAARPIIIMTFVVLLGSAAIVAAGLFWQYSSSQERIREIIGPALNLDPGFTGLPGALDLSKYSEHAEAALAELADSVGAYYSGCATCAPFAQTAQALDTTARKRDSVGSCPPMVYNDLVLKAYADKGLLFGTPIKPMIEDCDTALVISVAQYELQPEFDTLLPDHPSIDAPYTNVLTRTKEIAKLFSRAYPLFPNKTLHPSDTSSSWGTRDSATSTPDIPQGLVAFVHCSLILPRQAFSDSAKLGACMHAKGNRLREEKFGRLRPRVPASEQSADGWRRISSPADTLTETDSLPHLFVAYPASRLPRNFDCSQRPWYLAAMAESGPQWTASYPDAATGIPVVTLAMPIRLPQSDRIIGVVAVDYFTSRLLRYPKPGFGYLLNYSIIFLLTFSLVTIIAAGGRHRFDPLLYAFATLLFYYLCRICQWLYPVTSATAIKAESFFDILISILVSILYLSAGVAVFREFRHNPFKEPVKRKRTFVLEVLDKILPETKTSFLYILVRATLLTIAAYAIQVLIGAFVSAGQSELFLKAIDVLLSVVALVMFGHDFASWTRVYYRGWITFLCYILFTVYALIQIPPIHYGQTMAFWYAVAGAKFCALGLVVATVYGWSQHNNFERIRGTGSRAIMLERLGNPRRFIIMAGNIDKRRILFVDRSTLIALGWEKDPQSKKGKNDHAEKDTDDKPDDGAPKRLLGMEVYKSNHAILGWDVSEFGNDLYQPENDSIRLPEMFSGDSFGTILARLFDEDPRVQVWKDLGDRVTRRFTTIRMIRDVASSLKTKDGGEHSIRILSLTAWQDRDVPIDQPSYVAEQAVDSDWFFILCAETRGLPRHAAPENEQ